MIPRLKEPSKDDGEGQLAWPQSPGNDTTGSSLGCFLRCPND
jgi:hypothetical protein